MMEWKTQNLYVLEGKKKKLHTTWVTTSKNLLNIPLNTGGVFIPIS